jgi:two-component system response regulator EvgA
MNKVLIVDDHPVIRGGTHADGTSWIRGDGGNRQWGGCVATCARTLPDIVILDIGIPKLDGLEVIAA